MLLHSPFLQARNFWRSSELQLLYSWRICQRLNKVFQPESLVLFHSVLLFSILLRLLVYRWVSMHFLYILLHQWVHIQWQLIKLVLLILILSLMPLLLVIYVHRKTKIQGYWYVSFTSGNGSNLLHVYSVGWISFSNSSVIYAWIDIWSQTEFGKGWCYFFQHCKAEFFSSFFLSFLYSRSSLNFFLFNYITRHDFC